MELIRYVGERIRQLRNSYGGGLGISQEALAGELGLAANTVSRWETGTYRPGIEDLEKLSRFFDVSILQFFPKEDVKEDSNVMALLRAARDLPDEDIGELQKYAEFRKARVMFSKKQGKKTVGRPKKPSE